MAIQRWKIGAVSVSTTRRAFLSRYGDRPVTVFGTHFATPTAGHVVAHGSTWRFVPRTAE